MKLPAVKQLMPVLLLGAAALGVAASRPHAAEAHRAADAFEALYALPSPEHLPLLSLGYRSALADMIFASTLVSAGQHFRARKVFEHLDRYLEAVLALEPEFYTVYYYADSMLTMSTVEMPKRNWRIARDIQERGLRQFPDDPDLWMSVGQFIAYLAPQHMPPEEDKREWQRAGARIIEHACDVWPRDVELPVSCVGQARLLSKAGEHAAMIQSLERLIALTDDPEVRASATTRLEQLLGEAERERFRERVSALSDLQRRDLPYVSRAAYQLIGPPTQPERCAGLHEPSTAPGCSGSFRAWSDALERGASVEPADAARVAPGGG
jgi:hypothetical protein